MTEKKPQKIVVSLCLDESDHSLIMNGIKIAAIFKKELCLFYNHSGKNKNKISGYREKLYGYTKPLKKELPGLKVSLLLLSEGKRELPVRLADDFEAIIIVMSSITFSKYSRSLLYSPIPFLFVSANRNSVPGYKKLVLPVDWRKASSETALWASYFGRFIHSELVVVAANDKGKEEQAQVNRNVTLTKRLFQKFGIQHKIFKGTKSSLRNTFEALDLAHDTNSELLVLLGSSTITPLDILIGLPERKVIKRAGELPILVVNPRRDNYVLCD